MASYYGVLFEEFWTGRSGRELRRRGGVHAQVLAVYLVSNRHANMLGLYHLPLEDACYETGLKPAAVRKAFVALCDADFARYDRQSEFVWVLNMFRFRLGLAEGQALAASDKRALGANRLFHRLAENPHKAEFFARVSSALRLTVEPPALGGAPVGAPMDLADPFEGASKGLTGGSGGAGKPECSVQGTDHQVAGTTTHTDRAGARELGGEAASADGLGDRLGRVSGDPPGGVFGPRLIGNEHRAHAVCGRVCVPAFLHRNFKDALGGDEAAADTRLRAWYHAVDGQLPADAVVPSDAAKFWRPRFDAAFVTVAAPSAVKPVPVNRTGAGVPGKYAGVTQGRPGASGPGAVGAEEVRDV